MIRPLPGYYFVADDTVFNIWHGLPLDKLLNPEDIIAERYWWKPEEIQRAYDLFENKYKNHQRIGKSWQEYNESVSFPFPNSSL